MRVLVTGATGKVGQNFLPAFLARPAFADWAVTALCNNRLIPESDRLRVVKGSIADPATVARALEGVTHVVHMAAVKETPDQAIDVALKGMFLLLEAFRASPDADQFMLIGGDCSVGHMFQPYEGPVTEASPRKAYPGCYALTKVLEEVMLEQYRHQYGLNGCILRAPWIMEKDDFRYALAFGPEQFGGPSWSDLLDPEALARATASDHVPLMRDGDGRPLRRNFVHVSDLVAAMLAALDAPQARGQLFNISMTRPVDYGEAADLLARSRGYRVLEIPTRFHGNWLDNTKARQMLDWEPEVDLPALIEGAWNYRRDDQDPRKVWYPG